jgi:ribosomal protein S18 acetylase RimI-like enzyme
MVDVEAAQAALRDSGFAPVYEFCVMKRPDGLAPPPPPGPLPSGWQWVNADDSRAEAVHRALGESFAGAMSFALSPLPNFRRALAQGATTWRTLLDAAGEVAGLVQIAPSAGTSELRTVARVPRYRGHGLGPLLVVEGLRLLHQAGAREISLDVEALNDRALALYRRFGFQLAERHPVFGLTLRS